MFSGRNFPIFLRAERGGRSWHFNFQDTRIVVFYPTDVGFFETFVSFYQTTRRHILQDSSLTLIMVRTSNIGQNLLSVRA
jgi:hypothetical protein